MATSQNGWPVNPPRSARTIPGSAVRLTVADGPAGDVLMYVAGEFDRRVEDIDMKSSRGEFDDWGYANRNVRGSTHVSNHASATAVDVNATRHPLGVRGTFTRKQVDEIHRILAEVDDVVRWGGDYAGRVDEMHFEINDNVAAVAAVATRLVEEEDMPLTKNDANTVLMGAVTGKDPVTGKAETHAFAVWFTVLCFRVRKTLELAAEAAGRDPAEVDVDEAAVAANLAPMLVEALIGQLSELDDDDLQRLETAIAHTRHQAADERK